MRQMRRFLAILAVAVTLSALKASGTDYTNLDGRAWRAYTHGEWASAAALLDLMLEQRPEVASTYGRAITANAMRSDSLEQVRLLEKALANHIPFDSVFAQVEQWSFHLGNFHIYENFLSLARDSYPWMKRTVDAKLLAFYRFRSNGDKMIEFADAMLDGAPDNVGFLHSLAEGYMLTGRFDRGLDTFRRILEHAPDDYEALLAMGNWLHLHPADARAGESARTYLEHAQKINATPFVERILRSTRMQKDVAKHAN